MDGLELLGASPINLMSRSTATAPAPVPAGIDPKTGKPLLSSAPAPVPPPPAPIVNVQRLAPPALAPVPAVNVQRLAPPPAPTAIVQRLTPPAASLSPTTNVQRLSPAVAPAQSPISNVQRSGAKVPPPDKPQISASQRNALKSKIDAGTQKARAVAAAAARKVPDGKARKAIVHAANVHINRLQNAAVRTSVGQLSLIGAEIVDGKIVNADTSFLQFGGRLDPAVAAQLLQSTAEQMSEDDALLDLTELIGELKDIINNLPPGPYKSRGVEILQSMFDLSIAYDDAGASNPALPSQVAVIARAYHEWYRKPDLISQLPTGKTAEEPQPSDAFSDGGEGGPEQPSEGPSAPPALSVSGFSPSSAPVGSLVTVTGTGFTGATKVEFSGVSADFTIVNDSEIDVTVPQVQSGRVTVRAGSKSATSPQAFTVEADAYGYGDPYAPSGGGGDYESAESLDSGMYDYEDESGYEEYPDYGYGDQLADSGYGDYDSYGDPFSDAYGEYYADDPFAERVEFSDVMRDPYAEYYGDDPGYGYDDYGYYGGHGAYSDEEEYGDYGEYDDYGGFDGEYLDQGPPESALDFLYEQYGLGEHGDGLQLLGCDAVIGAYDLGQARKQMDSLKQVPVGAAHVFLRRGQQAVRKAMEVAAQYTLKTGVSLPGDSTRNNVQGHLQWHADELAKGTLDQTAMYALGDDLKKWVLQAFIEQNAAEEGAGIDVGGKAWSDFADMWAEIGAFVAKLPVSVATTIASIPAKMLEAATGIPVWAFWVGGALIVVLLGVGVWKLVTLAAPAAAKVAAQRYLP